MTARSAASPAATVLVCVTCKSEQGQVGAALHGALLARLDNEAIALRAVECLSVCKRPLTVALSGGSRFGYVIGDLDPALHLEDVVTGARAYAATADGLVPWRQRPQTFRKGVIARLPPIGFKQPEKTP